MFLKIPKYTKLTDVPKTETILQMLTTQYVLILLLTGKAFLLWLFHDDNPLALISF